MDRRARHLHDADLDRLAGRPDGDGDVRRRAGEGLPGAGHGARHPVDPGGADDQCGRTGAYFLDFVCSTYHTAVFWGLLAGGPQPSPTATTSPPPAGATCTTASNYAHVQAGRATTSGGYVRARGSGQAMGLYNTFVRHTLRESPAGYFTVADSGCP